MTNIQLYFAIGRPCLLVLVNMGISIWAVQASEHRLSDRLDRLDTRVAGDFAKTNDRIDRLDSRVEAGFAKTNDVLLNLSLVLGEHEGKLSNLIRK